MAARTFPPIVAGATIAFNAGTQVTQPDGRVAFKNSNGNWINLRPVPGYDGASDGGIGESNGNVPPTAWALFELKQVGGTTVAVSRDPGFPTGAYYIPVL